MRRKLLQRNRAELGSPLFLVAGENFQLRQRFGHGLLDGVNPVNPRTTFALNDPVILEQATVKYFAHLRDVVTFGRQHEAPGIARRYTQPGRVTTRGVEVARRGLPKDPAVQLEVHYVVDHEIVATEPVHLHRKDVTHGRNFLVVNDASEHVGTVKFVMTTGTGEQLEEARSRGGDSSRYLDGRGELTQIRSIEVLGDRPEKVPAPQSFWRGH